MSAETPQRACIDCHFLTHDHIDIDENPDFALAHYNLGYTYVLSNDRDSALEQYKILKTLDSEQANDLFDYINE